MNFLAYAVALFAVVASVVVGSPLERRWGGGFEGGIATYYYQGSQAGACGNFNSDDSLVVALDSSMYEAGKYCGKTVHVINLKNWKIINATVADECPTCKNRESLDLSRGAFKALGITDDEGIAPIWWWFQ